MLWQGRETEAGSGTAPSVEIYSHGVAQRGAEPGFVRSIDHLQLSFGVKSVLLSM